MNEPVAYRTKDVSETLGWRYSTLRPVTKNYEPLYTAEQLHSRVKMTQAEFDEFKQLSLSSAVTIYESLDYIRRDKDETNKFPNLFKRLFSGVDFIELKNQWEFANLRLYYDRFNPEETIEIVPEMKWFVRRILPNTGGNMLYCTDEGVLTYNNNKEHATKFDTKEEAEKWTNPLTEAVQLPVEEK